MIVRSAIRLLFWHNSLLTSYAAIAPGPTISLVVAFALARVLQVMASFVPLKILLLVTADGVPSYFRAFITPEAKNVWVVGLVVAVIAAYVLSIYLASVTRSIAHAGAAAVDRFRSGHPATTPPDTLVSGFAKVGESYGDLLFFVVAFAVGLYFNPVLFVAFAAVLAIEAAVFGIALRRYLANRDEGAEIVYDKWPKASGTFSTANFLIGFTILLLQFLLREHTNVLVGILSVFLMRQMLGALTRYSLHGTWIWQYRDELEPRTPETLPRRRILPRHVAVLKNRLQPRCYRDELSRRIAAAGYPTPSRIEHALLDGQAPDCIVVRSLVRFDDGSRERTFVDRIYFAQGPASLKHEDLCLQHLPDLTAWTGTIVSTDTKGPLTRRLAEVPFSAIADPAQAKDTLRQLQQRFWQIRPSDGLERLWRARHPSLASRLASAPLALLTAAAASEAERASVRQLSAQLPSIQALVDSAPMYVANARLGRTGVFVDDSGLPWVVDWTKWRLEPLGVGLLSISGPDVFAREMVELLQADARTSAVSEDLLFLVAYVADLLTKLERLHLTSALQVVPEVLTRTSALQERSQPRSVGS